MQIRNYQIDSDRRIIKEFINNEIKNGIFIDNYGFLNDIKPDDNNY